MDNTSLAYISAQLDSLIRRLDEMKTDLQRIESARVVDRQATASVEKDVVAIQLEVRHVKEHLGTVDKRLNDKASRIAALEQKVYTWAGAAMVLGAAGSYFLRKFFG